jgi:hypothetical protein
VLSFEHKYAPLDLNYEREAVPTFVDTLKAQFPPPVEEDWRDFVEGEDDLLSDENLEETR